MCDYLCIRLNSCININGAFGIYFTRLNYTQRKIREKSCVPSFFKVDGAFPLEKKNSDIYLGINTGQK